ncbi:MAG: hypothetical protein K2I71_01505 [Helicobacter sp.]|nr:hypothetical protein [Helicobacter sp.]
MDHLLTLIIFFPFLAAIFAITIKDNLKAYAIIVGIIELSLTILLWMSFDFQVDGFQFITSFPLVENFGVYYIVGVDGISLFLILLSAFISVIGFIYLNEKTEVKKLVISLLFLFAYQLLIKVYVNVFNM